MTVKRLAIQFAHHILQGSRIVQDGDPVNTLVMEDLIQNVYTLFDQRPSQFPPVPSNAAETTSVHTYGSLFLSPESPQSTTQHPELGGIPTSTQSSFSSSPSDATANSRLEPPPNNLLSPLLGLSSSRTFTEGVETTTIEQVIPARAVETLPNSTPPDVEYIPATRRMSTSFAEWGLHQSRLPPDPEAGTMPQSPSGSVLSSSSDFPLSSATSLQTRTLGFSP